MGELWGAGRHLLLAWTSAIALATAIGISAAAASPLRPLEDLIPGDSCVGETEADQVPQKPADGRLRYGIHPLVKAGQVGPLPAGAVPETPRRTHSALVRLRPDSGPFVLRLNRFFWSRRSEGVRRYLALADRFTSRGYLVELQLRYHPNERQEGHIRRWTRFVRTVVRRFGRNERVVGIQVANEVNLTFSPDSSDGAYEGARAALVRGVIAAKREARRRGHQQLEVGFNWFYRTDPASESRFWEYLADRGGARFVRALDWIGLDAYPDTFFPPVELPGDERDGMVNAMSTLRCYARIADIPRSIPMRVEENGWPTPPGRPYQRQASFLRNAVDAVHDFRGTYNVTDYRWFNLRDADTGDPRLAQRFGLMESDYDRKPAFRVYERLVDRRSVRRSPGMTLGGATIQPGARSVADTTGIGSCTLSTRARRFREC
jgi:hypothetical protein